MGSPVAWPLQWREEGTGSYAGSVLGQHRRPWINIKATVSVRLEEEGKVEAFSCNQTLLPRFEHPDSYSHYRRCYITCRVVVNNQHRPVTPNKRGMQGLCRLSLQIIHHVCGPQAWDFTTPKSGMTLNTELKVKWHQITSWAQKTAAFKMTWHVGLAL